MSSQTTIIRQLHEYGYTEDFQVNEDGLLWIQGKSRIKAGDFSITGRYPVQPEHEDDDDIIIYCISVNSFAINGILSVHYNKYPRRSPPIIINKLAEMYGIPNQIHIK